MDTVRASRRCDPCAAATVTPIDFAADPVLAHRLDILTRRRPPYRAEDDR